VFHTGPLLLPAARCPGSRRPVRRFTGPPVGAGFRSVAAEMHAVSQERRISSLILFAGIQIGQHVPLPPPRNLRNRRRVCPQLSLSWGGGRPAGAVRLWSAGPLPTGAWAPGRGRVPGVPRGPARSTFLYRLPVTERRRGQAFPPPRSFADRPRSQLAKQLQAGVCGFESSCQERPLSTALPRQRWPGPPPPRRPSSCSPANVSQPFPIPGPFAFDSCQLF